MAVRSISHLCEKMNRINIRLGNSEGCDRHHGGAWSMTANVIWWSG